jgi:uncharacterized protein YndB with AHSA1/START domain
MSDTATLARYGLSPEPNALVIERLLPGPLERVWAYLTESDRRRRWLAAGEMELRLGGRVDLVWRNDTLTGHAEMRPEGQPGECRMAGSITRLEPPCLLAFTWGEEGEVTFALAAEDDSVRLTVTHRRLRTRGEMLDVSGGWHAHLDILEAVLRGQSPPPFWSSWLRLREEYDRRLAG